jgi:two-component system response regulator PhoP
LHILVIEDEERLARNLATAIGRNAGFAVDVALNGDDGLHLAMSHVFDAIILDLMLPGRSGREILRSLRVSGDKTPILVLTATDEKGSIVDLLNDGADDYLAKPFDLGELLARIKALIRRSSGHASAQLVVSDLVLDSNSRAVFRSGKRIDLAPMEYRTLAYLMTHQGTVVSKEKLLEHLYDYNWEKFSNVIEVYISALRRKIDTNSSERLIHTLRGHGYVIRSEEPQ